MEFLIILIILIAILLAIFRTPKMRGKLGEIKVSMEIGKTIEGKQYVINNYIIEVDGKSSQIDHIVINSRGIFVVETKNYSGNIYGSDEQYEWTQVFNYGKVKNKFYNPVKQNATHIYRIKQILSDFPIYSVIVFVQGNTENINSGSVISLSSLRKRLNDGKEILSVEQMKKANELLLNNKSELSTKNHVKNIHKQQEDVSKGICPRCGAQLVKKKGQYGEFWGCSNYPQCKFIKKQ